MDYKVVELKEKKILGVSARTGNGKPDMQQVIGGLWNDYYGNGVCQSIESKVSEHAFGIYSDYENDTYKVTVGAEVKEFPEDLRNLSQLIIPAGKYACFHVFGDQVKAVSEAWNEIWGTKLERTFTGDFEEYVSFDGVNAAVDIYVAVK